MSQIEIKKIKKFITKLNLISIDPISIIKSGKNSKIYKINTGKKIIILKSYYGKNNTRIKKEFEFYQYLNQENIKNVITPIAFDFRNNFAAFPFIEGNKIKIIKKNHIVQFANFINKINQKNKYPKKLGLATEGIMNRKNYIEICKKRINKLQLVDKKGLIKKDFHLFLTTKIIPKFNFFKKKINDRKILNHTKYKLYKKDMIISPSDFGFNNAIVSGKKIFFFDFEYSGYDDSVKLICDFYCQPNQKVSPKLKEIFKVKIIKNYKNYKELDYLISELLPINYIKWCCIILNEFLPSKLNTRKHAGQLNKNSLQVQLTKAKNYFNQNLEEYQN